MPQANSTAFGLAGRTGGDTRSALPVQHADEREQAARGVEVDLDLFLQPLLEQIRALIVQSAPAHVDRLDLSRRCGADRLVIAVADQEIVLHDLAEWCQRQKMRHYRRAVLLSDVEHQPVLADREIEDVWPPIVLAWRKGIILDQ